MACPADLESTGEWNIFQSIPRIGNLGHLGVSKSSKFPRSIPLLTKNHFEFLNSLPGEKGFPGLDGVIGQFGEKGKIYFYSKIFSLNFDFLQVRRDWKESLVASKNIAEGKNDFSYEEF